MIVTSPFSHPDDKSHCFLKMMLWMLPKLTKTRKAQIRRPPPTMFQFLQIQSSQILEQWKDSQKRGKPPTLSLHLPQKDNTAPVRRKVCLQARAMDLKVVALTRGDMRNSTPLFIELSPIMSPCPTPLASGPTCNFSDFPWLMKNMTKNFNKVNPKSYSSLVAH